MAVDGGGEKVVLTLEGAWARRNLQPLRDALARAAAQGKPLCIVFSEVSHIDSAFVALMMISAPAFAEGFEMVDASPAVRRTLRHHRALYLLNPPCPRP